MELYQDISSDTCFDAVIIANGDFPCHDIPLGILRGAKYIVCCDGACLKTIEAGIEPNAVVGDGDSLPADIQLQLGNKLHIVDEQDYNDLTKATRYVLANIPNAKKIAYIGATGKREDHTLGNISLMSFFVSEFAINPVLITDHGYFVVAKGHHSFATSIGQQVSIFNISCSKLSGNGLKWQPYTFSQLWQGTLNEALGSEIEIDGNGTYLVFRNFIR